MNSAVAALGLSISQFICYLKKGQRITPNTDIVKVNIGSGLQVADGWINIDCNPYILFSKWPPFSRDVLYRLFGFKKRYSQTEYIDIFEKNIFILHNLEYGLPFPDGSVDYIYSSHSLEHLYRDDAIKVLGEAFRVLKDSGRIRICLPDLEYAISLYQNGNKRLALGFFFTTSRTEYFSCHKYMYDFDLIRSILEELGFSDVKRFLYKQGIVPDADKLDNRPDETLFVEAVKSILKR